MSCKPEYDVQVIKQNNTNWRSQYGMMVNFCWHMKLASITTSSKNGWEKQKA